MKEFSNDIFLYPIMMQELLSVQLLGICAGCFVFLSTLGVVFALLYYGGSFQRIKSEEQGMPSFPFEKKRLLYDELLQKASQLPSAPPILGEMQLSGDRVTIRDYDIIADAQTLFKISSGQATKLSPEYDADKAIWTLLTHGPYRTEACFRSYYSAEQNDDKHFVMSANNDEGPVGMFTLTKHAPKDLRIEIADVWLHPRFQGTGINAEAMLLLLRHLFHLQYRRVEWRCDGYNVRGRRAAHSMGFTFEGVLRKHRIVKNCSRDTVVFAIINSEWPCIESRLESLISRKP